MVKKLKQLSSLILVSFFVCPFLFSPGLHAGDLTPDWAKDLVIYEVAIKGFTSPAGPESGTFKSLMAKMEYLEELGINAIWLTGHSSSDPDHFYGIWTQYACIEPDKLDPSLGTEQDFTTMVAEAHRHGILIILDTIEHGVMNYSPLIEEHPDWFKGGSWGMTDYDWKGDHPDLEEWWINIWTKAVLEWDVDGFRCDMGLHRPDLWAEIRRRCIAAGKPIVILGESGNETVSDACQRDIMLYSIRNGKLDQHAVLNDLASVGELFHKEFNGFEADFKCEVFYTDSSQDTDKLQGRELEISYLGLGDDVIGKWEYEPDDLADWSWLAKGVDTDRPYENLRVTYPKRNWSWQLVGGGWKVAIEETTDGLKVSGGNPTKAAKLRIIAPSCHDCGWDGFPLDKNPYTVQGSRHVFGYGALFAPAIPLFMSGEEFNADYRPLPKHTPGLFGKGEPGTGRWLYGSWIQWEQLQDIQRSDMLTDVKRMLAIRRDHQDLIHAVPLENAEIKMSRVPYSATEDIPVPYVLTNGKRALLIAGNPLNKDVAVELELSLEILGLSEKTKKLQVVELWPSEQSSKRLRTKKLSKYKCTIPADGTLGGGLHVVRFEAN